VIRNRVDKIKEARPQSERASISQAFYINKLKNSTHHAPANATHAQNIIVPFITTHHQTMILSVNRDDNKGTHLNQLNNPDMSCRWRKQNPPMGEVDTSRN